MALWQEFATSHPDLVERSDYLARALPPQLAGEWIREVSPSADVLEHIVSPSTPPNGVLGTGAWWLDRDSPPVAVVFVSDMIQKEPRPVGESPFVRALLEYEKLVDDLDFHAWVVPIAIPEPLAGAAASVRISIGARSGSRGANAVFQGRRGFLTAGHVAPLEGAVVRDDTDSVIGRVVRTLRRGVPVDNVPSADVAFVGGMDDRNTVTTRRIARSVREGETILVGGAMSTWVQGLSPHLLLEQNAPGWGEAALTADPVASNGDSGAEVTTESGELVGHVVGGKIGGYSVIQDAPFQLARLGIDAVL